MINHELRKILFDALELEKNGEDGAAYLAANCSMLNLAELTTRFPSRVSIDAAELIREAKRMQEAQAKQGQTIRIY